MEDVVPFEISKITLSGRDKSANPLTASVYTLEGVTNADGSLRLMSIGQLCMAICLQRAAKVELDLVGKMNEMAENSASLKTLSDVEQKIADKYNTEYSGSSTSFVVEFPSATLEEFDRLMTSQHGYATGKAPYTISAADSKGNRKITVTSSQADQFFTDVEATMDALNTTSQELLIDIESLTAKRDDTYSLVSNLTKSFYQACSAIGNNLP